MFNQFANVPPPSSIANLPGLETVFEPRSNAPQQFHQGPSVNLLDFHQISNERRDCFHEISQSLLVLKTSNFGCILNKIRRSHHEYFILC